MTDNRTVSLTISLPKGYRDLLRTKAAEWNMEHPDSLLTGARIGRDMIIEQLDNWLKEQGGNDVQVSGKERMQ